MVLKQYYKVTGRTNKKGKLFLSSVKRMETQKKPLQMHAEDVQYMIESATTLRDKAIIAVLADMGWRAGELCSMSVKDVRFDANGVLLSCANSKTQVREVRGIACTALLRTWVNDHPFKNDPDAWLFCIIKPTKGRPVGSQLNTKSITNLFQNVRRRAMAIHPGMGRVHAHKLRAWDITQCHRQGLPDLENLVRHGQKCLEMIRTYVDADAEASNDKYLEIHGKKKTVPPPTSAPCPRCHEENMVGSSHCPNCGSPMNVVVMTHDEHTERQKQALEEATGETIAHMVSRLVREQFRKEMDGKEILGGEI
ncbi:MAG TPA: site-specific integrase [Candidatus Lokiarchaeia archaeon]|nr:site-specific integrase [Candidatus Lokiarchaeia archaeon]